MVYGIADAARHALAKTVEKRLVDAMCSHDYPTWRVVNANPVRTHRNFGFTLVELVPTQTSGNVPETPVAFAAVDPLKKKVIAIRRLVKYAGDVKNEAQLRLDSLPLDVGGFEIKRGYRSRGVGSALTAHTISRALKLGERVTTNMIRNPRWAGFYRGIGFTSIGDKLDYDMKSRCLVLNKSSALVSAHKKYLPTRQRKP